MTVKKFIGKKFIGTAGLLACLLVSSPSISTSFAQPQTQPNPQTQPQTQPNPQPQAQTQAQAEAAGAAAEKSKAPEDNTDIHAVDESVEQMQPYMQVRVVQNLQTQTAKGSKQALVAEQKLIPSLNQHFLDLPPDTWGNEQNARAAVIHLLSGGHPAVGHRLLSLDPPAAVDPQLLQGAVAYIEGRKGEARAALSSIDPLKLSPTLGGQIALVQAIVALPDNPAAALIAIDKARLLLPGSLVEEAALRRGVSVASTMNDPRLLQTYALQYMRRFNNSIYNSDFRRRFALAMRRFGKSKDEAVFTDLDTVIAQFDLDARRSLYLLLSYSSLIAGNVKLANQAAETALPLSLDNTESQSRAHLYLAGSMLEADKIRQSLEHLWKVKRSKLSSRDQILADKIALVLNNIRAWPESDAPAFEFSFSSAAAAKGEPEWQLDTIDQAKRAIQETDLFLSSSTQASAR
nr:chemotaxis protein [uncultured Cohaesibacter sp.]